MQKIYRQYDRTNLRLKGTCSFVIQSGDVFPGSLPGLNENDISRCLDVTCGGWGLSATLQHRATTVVRIKRRNFVLPGSLRLITPLFLHIFLSCEMRPLTCTRHPLLFHSRSTSECAWRQESRRERHQQHDSRLLLKSVNRYFDCRMSEDNCARCRHEKFYRFLVPFSNVIVHSDRLITGSVFTDHWLMINSAHETGK